MMPKELFWSGLKGGLFEEKHRRAMGEAIWLFGWLVTRQSQVQEKSDGTLDGLPHYGNPLTDEQISADTGFPVRSIQHWRKVLIATGYIRTVRVGNLGLIYFINKAKKKAKNPKPSTRYFAAELLSNGNWQARVKKQSANVKVSQNLVPPEAKVSQNLVPPEAKVSQNLVPTLAKSCTTCADKHLDSQQDKQPFGGGIFTPKHLLNYKTPAAAPSIPSFSEKQTQGQPLSLQEQIEEVKRRGLCKSPGRVVELQTKEATA